MTAVTQCEGDSLTLRDEPVFKMIYENNGYYRSVEITKASEAERESARRCILAIDRYFTPADREYIKGAVFILLRHFYEKKMTDQEYSAIAQDWIAVLAKYPAWVIKEARLAYLANNRKKPVPADIVELCDKSFSRVHALKNQCQKVINLPLPVESEITDEERQAMLKRVSEVVEKAKKDLYND